MRKAEQRLDASKGTPGVSTPNAPAEEKPRVQLQLEPDLDKVAVADRADRESKVQSEEDTSRPRNSSSPLRNDHEKVAETTSLHARRARLSAMGADRCVSLAGAAAPLWNSNSMGERFTLLEADSVRAIPQGGMFCRRGNSKVDDARVLPGGNCDRGTEIEEKRTNITRICNKYAIKTATGNRIQTFERLSRASNISYGSTQRFSCDPGRGRLSVQGRHEGRVIPSPVTHVSSRAARVSSGRYGFSPIVHELRTCQRPMAHYKGDEPGRGRAEEQGTPRLLIPGRLLRRCEPDSRPCQPIRHTGVGHENPGPVWEARTGSAPQKLQFPGGDLLRDTRNTSGHGQETFPAPGSTRIKNRTSGQATPRLR